jgi:D-tyrosyl-tRNA(Tyr) deacylase
LQLPFLLGKNLLYFCGLKTPVFMTSSPKEVATDCPHYHRGYATAMSEIQTGHDMY